MNGASQTLSFDSLLFHLSPSSAVLTFFIVSTGTLSLTSCDVGSDTLTKLNDHTISSVHVSNDPSLGTVIHLSLGTTFSSTIDTLFDEIASNGTGSLIFVEASDLDSTSKQAPFALLKSSIEPPQGRLFTEAEKDEFVGQVGTDSPESMFSFGFPHTIQETTLSVHGEGEDHANCGLTQLPCETLDKGFSSLKRTESTLLVGGSTSLAKPHSTSFTEQTIKSKSGIATITTASSASFSVLVDHTLHLTSLAILFGTDQRSTSFISISTGSLSIESCSFRSAATASTLNDALFNIVGSMTIKSSIKTRISTSSSTGLFSIDLSGTHSLSVISTSLVSYTASAAPLVSLTLSNNTELTDWKFNLSGLSFPAASSNVVPRGALIFVSGTSFATQIVHSRFPSVDSSTDPEAFRGMILRLKCPHRCLSI
ncbi:hypothetical protein BLNAU_6727 [Blattamonas nauphoetae]|uniref:GPI-anchored surface protein n=1 Tax=Blattamonas nauphoetae TaxID=2049346 RepID=A0ABQ9Y3B6_9EUKA|nr:hypothetical protein BLNAU_8121 [Blattamonas nauphoetae]KAK2958240.1 hypothetical protein BLNAU_6727 [Blattamonas nauphoetae]